MAILRSIDEISSVVTAGTPRTARTIVGIVGSPGAGKSTVGEALVARLNARFASAQLVSMDGFHLPQSRLVELGRRDRMGAPDTFDIDGFVALLERLRADAGPVAAPGFDRDWEEATPGTVPIADDRRVIIVEGNYLLHDRDGWQRVAPLLDLALFVGVERDIRLARLIARHERYGKSAADAAAWALGPDEANAQLIERTAARADHEVRLA
ncbi:pantothenate kinase [Marisediminicola sp. UYEF4]|uniref:nucleoside/nucleotide kinase family protein n=1 Tax=Marisediminicola sp. UYEF4 TaxID=1756384 RepID=UPI003399C73F